MKSDRVAVKMSFFLDFSLVSLKEREKENNSLLFLLSSYTLGQTGKEEKEKETSLTVAGRKEEERERVQQGSLKSREKLHSNLRREKEGGRTIKKTSSIQCISCLNTEIFTASGKQRRVVR